MKNSNTIVAAKSSLVHDVKTTSTSIDVQFSELYKKKDYKGAANYLLQNKQQLNSGIFHYNLGTVYSKIGDYPAARFHLEKSLKEGYINSSSLNNLIYVKSQLQVDDISTSSNLPDQFMNTVLIIPPAAYVSFSLVLLLLGIALVKSKRLVKKISMALMLILIILPIAFSQFYLNKVNYAITFHEAPLYEGPSKIFSEKGKIRAGSKIILGDYKEGWFYVKFPISLTGWVNKDQLGLY
jgi:tetratricopeptide (TPR) repeat protein